MIRGSKVRDFREAREWFGNNGDEHNDTPPPLSSSGAWGPWEERDHHHLKGPRRKQGESQVFLPLFFPPPSTVLTQQLEWSFYSRSPVVLFPSCSEYSSWLDLSPPSGLGLLRCLLLGAFLVTLFEMMLLLPHANSSLPHLSISQHMVLFDSIHFIYLLLCITSEQRFLQGY